LKGKRRSKRAAKGKRKGLKWQRRQKRHFRQQAKKLNMKQKTLDAETERKESGRLSKEEWKAKKGERRSGKWQEMKHRHLSDFSTSRALSDSSSSTTDYTTTYSFDYENETITITASYDGETYEMSHDDFVAEVFYTAGDEYPSFVPAAICDVSEYLCSDGEPVKEEICPLQTQFEDIQMYVMDLDLLCGYTNDRDEVIES